MVCVNPSDTAKLQTLKLLHADCFVPNTRKRPGEDGAFNDRAINAFARTVLCTTLDVETEAHEEVKAKFSEKEIKALSVGSSSCIVKIVELFLVIITLGCYTTHASSQKAAMQKHVGRELVDNERASIAPQLSCHGTDEEANKAIAQLKESYGQKLSKCLGGLTAIRLDALKAAQAAVKAAASQLKTEEDPHVLPNGSDKLGRVNETMHALLQTEYKLREQFKVMQAELLVEKRAQLKELHRNYLKDLLTLSAKEEHRFTVLAKGYDLSRPFTDEESGGMEAVYETLKTHNLTTLRQSVGVLRELHETAFSPAAEETLTTPEAIAAEQTRVTEALEHPDSADEEALRAYQTKLTVDLGRLTNRPLATLVPGVPSDPKTVVSLQHTANHIQTINDRLADGQPPLFPTEKTSLETLRSGMEARQQEILVQSCRSKTVCAEALNAITGTSEAEEALRAKITAHSASKNQLTASQCPKKHPKNEEERATGVQSLKSWRNRVEAQGVEDPTHTDAVNAEIARLEAMTFAPPMAPTGVPPVTASGATLSAAAVAAASAPQPTLADLQRQQREHRAAWAEAGAKLLQGHTLQLGSYSRKETAGEPVTSPNAEQLKCNFGVKLSETEWTEWFLLPACVGTSTSQTEEQKAFIALDRKDAEIETQIRDAKAAYAV